MAHEMTNRREAETLGVIAAADERDPGLWRQLRNGIGGLAILLVTGVVVVLLVLWKSP